MTLSSVSPELPRAIPPDGDTDTVQDERRAIRVTDNLYFGRISGVVLLGCYSENEFPLYVFCLTHFVCLSCIFEWEFGTDRGAHFSGVNQFANCG